MKKRRVKIRPLPPELASAAKRKALFAGLLREGDTPSPILQNNAYPARKPNAAKDLSGKTADGPAAPASIRRRGGGLGNPSSAERPKDWVGVAAALPARQQKCGAPKGNRNALRHGRFTAKRRAARAQVRRILADVDMAIALAFCATKGEG